MPDIVHKSSVRSVINRKRRRSGWGTKATKDKLTEAEKYILREPWRASGSGEMIDVNS